MRWTLKDRPAQNVITQYAQELSVDQNLSCLLIQRGIDTFKKAKDFFRPSFEQLHDPFLMKDMQEAVLRIEQAVKKEENILVYGDYDVDGTTAVSLLATYLRSFYSNIATYIPDRYKEGYGISYQGIDFAKDNGFSLIIALDCGIKAIDKVQYASKKGIDFIICDHHRPGDILPDAIAVLDPKREDCNYPYDELCGCGVGFKLVQGLASHRGDNIQDLIPYLDLVATAVAADIVPITGENRILTYFGLQQINSNPRVGIKALIHQLNKKELTITDVVFIIAPRINAAGRMKHGHHAVELLTETDFEHAVVMAEAIEQFNTDRRNLDELITKEAIGQIEENNEIERFSTVVYNEHWHKGVIGIVASRLIENYYRPTLVFTKNGGKLAASARSVRGFDVYNALEACSDHIEQFGGHKYAAGLTLKEENYQVFKNKFEEVVRTTITEELLIPEIKVDMEMEFKDLTPKFYRILKQFAPFGPGNMKPVFLAKDLRDTGFSRKVGGDKSHLKLDLISKSGHKINGIGFNLGHYYDEISKGKIFDVVFTLEENHWNGNVTLQMNAKDIKL